MKSNLKARVALLSLALASIWGCAKTPATSSLTAQAAKATDTYSVKASDDLMAMLRLGEPQLSPMSGSIEVAGRIEANEIRIARVSAPVSGRITDLDVVEGQNVKKNDLLAVVTSTQLSEGQAAYLRAHLARRQAERAVERAKRLLESDVIGEAELQRREAEFVQANLDLNAAKDQLRLLGMPEDAMARLETTRTVNAISHVLATIDGTVLQRSVTPGQMVQSAETVCVLADLSNVWLIADVPEQAAGSVTVGKQVEAEIPALPGVKLHGKLSFVSATVNPETRTVRIRMDLPNPARRFKPAMLATMLVKDLPEMKRVIPLGAIVREENRDYVFVQTGPKSFRMRAVNLAPGNEGNKILVDGVASGEKIALDGAFHLNTERKRQALGGSE
jgi:cobalt-zinc-cadmium efflux system membrane fusion protein